MEAEAIDTLMAQNKALAQQINLLNSKLGTMQLAAANTQIGTCDLCRIQGHSSESCAAILEQQSSEQVNYMGQGNQFQQDNQFDQGQRQFNNNFQQQTPSLVQPNTSKQLSGLELALQKLTLSTTTFVDGTTNFMNETKATLKT
ncbi:hypothetical protein PIB30_062382 [Stylosanthes scabra]|uniref:Uncharacterized protein n=1 Tax=Stylosanthes scabra TaxID=79078 RepID=A0ABU6WM95_9FABA|nr:hypothetical protein [Stylosanthes scabra]